MAGEPTNDAPGSFASADVEEAAQRLARILREEDATRSPSTTTTAATAIPTTSRSIASASARPRSPGTPHVFEATTNRDALHPLDARTAAGDVTGIDEIDMPTAEDLEGIGVAEARITTTVDVREYAALKRRALAAHASQVGPDSFFLAMPERSVRRGLRLRVVHPPRRARRHARDVDLLTALGAGANSQAVAFMISRERVGDRGGEVVDVGDELAARDEAEVDVVEVRHDREVEAAVVDDRAERVERRRGGRPRGRAGTAARARSTRSG